MGYRVTAGGEYSVLGRLEAHGALLVRVRARARVRVRVGVGVGVRDWVGDRVS